jgi:hypothetical protein
VLAYCVAPCVLAYAGVAGADPLVVAVNPAVTHTISPYIYGINGALGVEGANHAAVTVDRLGGNRWTAYNWETNASNAGSDYLFQNDSSLSSSSEAGAAVSEVIAQDRKRGMASIVTVPMQGFVSADTNGPVSLANPPDKSRFKKLIYDKKLVSDAPFTAKPPTSDDYVFADEFVWALDHKFAGQNLFGAQPTTLPVFLSLDNEPELWKTTHVEVQGQAGITSESYIARTISLATALKKQFPACVLFGPVHYGFLGVYSWNDEWHPNPSGNDWFADKYMRALHTAADEAGRPLVDVYDFHWYPEATDSAGKRITDLSGPKLTADQVQAIVQGPRSLWDKTYKEKSWITNAIGQPIYILARLQSKIDADNPGMKLAITEYNNGGGQHIAGTIAQADALGVFATHSLFAANMWRLGPKEAYSLGGFRAFRNFDGAGHSFGDTSVAATSDNVANVSVYVSTDSSRPGRVVIVAINRSATDQQTTINGQPLAGSAHLFQMTAASAAKQSAVQPVAAGMQPVSGSSLTVTLPALSVTTLDVY